MRHGRSSDRLADQIVAIPVPQIQPVPHARSVDQVAAQMSERTHQQILKKTVCAEAVQITPRALLDKCSTDELQALLLAFSGPHHQERLRLLTAGQARHGGAPVKQRPRFDWCAGCPHHLPERERHGFSQKSLLNTHTHQIQSTVEGTQAQSIDKVIP